MNDDLHTTAAAIIARIRKDLALLETVLEHDRSAEALPVPTVAAEPKLAGGPLRRLVSRIDKMPDKRIRPADAMAYLLSIHVPEPDAKNAISQGLLKNVGRLETDEEGFYILGPKWNNEWPRHRR